MQPEVDRGQSPTEQPVREQLRKTKIDTETPDFQNSEKIQHSQNVSSDTKTLNESTDKSLNHASQVSNERPSRKRSRENLGKDGGEDANTSSNKHLRKRSRDDAEAAPSGALKSTNDGLRSSEQLSYEENHDINADVVTEHSRKANVPDNEEDAETISPSTGQADLIQGSNKEFPKIPALASTADTFQSPSSSASQAITSDTASQTEKASNFKASGFASFAAASKSPFSTFAQPGLSKTEGKKEANGDSAQAFTSLKPSSGALSFASSVSSVSPFSSQIGSDKPAVGIGQGFKSSAISHTSESKPFGPSSGKIQPWGVKHDSEDDGEESGDDDAIEDSRETPIGHNDTDSRFHKQEVGTGEENEKTVFSERAKIYFLADRQWKEGGAGYFKMNIMQGNSNERRVTARFILRADRSHRLLLNSPFHKDLKFEDPAGGSPRGKTAIFMGFKDSKPTMMQVKMNSNAQLVELYEHVKKWFEED